MREQIVSAVGLCGNNFLSALGLYGNKMLAYKAHTRTNMVKIMGFISALVGLILNF